ncbi:hypothetical protein APY94_01585 [Thermococcus celericrescens]|uniref:Uncharacterized protein n=1 Tax=Thermococcus celericrescens TaxID=227598 RepID=A0A117IU36_9EURY|nr:hypothetical protein [Thermococcus celericrescens]KUH34536.1 hypothetical protein APY94_01585 [Thermococcus celericrescens]
MWDVVRKTKKLIAGILLALLLAGGQALASNVAGAGSTTTSGTAMAGNATFNATLQDRAYYMLTLLEGVANYTTELMDNLNAIDNKTMNLYAEAENLRQSSWAAYDMGNYSAAMTIAMNAMEVYELVVERIVPAGSAGRPGMGPGMGGMMNGQEALYWAKIELQRAREYLAYVSRIIDEASKLGIDTSEISALYSQTVEAYNRVEADIENGDVSSLGDDMRRAESLRMQLEMAVEGLVREILTASAGDIAETFTKKLEAELNRTSELMALMESVIGNTSDTKAPMMLRMLEMRRTDLQNMLGMVQRLIDSGRYEMALRMVKEINLELEETIMEIGQTAMEFRNGYMMDYCGQYANTTAQPMNPDYQKYCNQSWWGQWEREMDDMMGTGWWNEEESHMGARMGMSQNGSWNSMGMGSMGGWNGPWWSDEERMNQGTSGNGSMGGSWMNPEDNYGWNGAHDDWSESWMGTNNWTMNQINGTTGGNIMEDEDDNHMENDQEGNMGSGMNNNSDNDQDNHMEDSNDDSNDNWSNDQGNNDSNDNSSGCGNCSGGGNWGNWWGG